MFDKFRNNKRGAQFDANGNAIEQALIKQEQAVDLIERQQAVAAKIEKINATRPLTLDNAFEMIGDIGTDTSISQSVVDNVGDMMGNNSDPIKAVKNFSGMIAQRILTIADVRKRPANLVAWRGGVALDITTDYVYAQPVRIFAACGQPAPVRQNQQPFNAAFDDNGELKIGADSFSNYVTNTIGSYPKPFCCHYFVVKQKDTLKGDSKFYIKSEHGYEAGVQLTDSTMYFIMLNHQKALKLGATYAVDVNTPPNLVVDMTFNTTEPETYYEVDLSTPTDVTVSGLNVSITHYELPLYAPLNEGVLATMLAGQLQNLPTWLLNALMAQHR